MKEKEDEGYTIYRFKNCKENLKDMADIAEQVNLFVNKQLFLLEDDLGIEALRDKSDVSMVLILSKKSRKKTNYKTLKFEKYSKEDFVSRINELMKELSITLKSDINEFIDATCYYKVDDIDYSLIKNYLSSKQGLNIGASDVMNDFRNQGFTLEDNAFKLLNAIVFKDNALETLKDLMRSNDSHKIFGGLLYQLRQINKFLCSGGDIKGTDISGYQTSEYKGYIEHLGIIKIQELNNIALEGYGIINTMPDKVLLATVTKMIRYIKNI
ncbi:MAG: hypothetical protein PHN69_08445 [Candidatus Pacebacteria bacterium]|nr:hypothetical protein [Candidatus Paceibacterota bacterium]